MLQIIQGPRTQDPPCRGRTACVDVQASAVQSDNGRPLRKDRNAQVCSDNTVIKNAKTTAHFLLLVKGQVLTLRYQLETKYPYDSQMWSNKSLLQTPHTIITKFKTKQKYLIRHAYVMHVLAFCYIL